MSFGSRSFSGATAAATAAAPANEETPAARNRRRENEVAGVVPSADNWRCCNSVIAFFQLRSHQYRRRQ